MDKTKTKVGAVLVEVRHTTPHDTYRRCGLVITRRWAEAEIGSEERALLEADSWVEIRSTEEKPGLKKGKSGETALKQNRTGAAL